MSLATEPVPARGGTADRDEPARAATILVIVAAIGCAALLLYLGRDRTFFFDEWNWVQDRSFGGVKTLLEPHNEHVSIFPVAIYRVLFEVFGLSHGWPFRLPVIVVHLACCGFLFVLVRRRAGAAWAAVAAILLLFLGQAWEDLLWGFQVGFLLSVLGGLVAWWALDRGDRTGDIVACAALCVGALSSSLGVPIAVGVGAELLVSRRRGALWIPIVPLALYGLWYLGYGKSAITADGIYHAPGWAVDAAAAASGSLFGRGLDYGRPLLFVALALVVFGVLRRGVTPRLAGVLVAGGAFWLLTGAARSAGATPTQPESSRYLYLGAVVLLLVGAELLRGRPLPRAGWWIAAALAALAVLQGLTALGGGSTSLRASSDDVKAQIAAAELARDRLPADFHFAPDVAPQLVASKFVETVRVNGSSPVEDPRGELASAGARERGLADDVFVAVDAALDPARACRGGAPQPSGEREAPSGGLTVTAGAAPVPVSVRRYGDAPHDIGSVPAGESRRVRIAPDRAPQPWHVALGAAATVC